MSDLIDRQAVIDILDKAWVDGMEYEGWLHKEVGELPTAEPDIIACGDCKHYIPHDRRCGYWNHGVKPLMWCSQAERRTDG